MTAQEILDDNGWILCSNVTPRDLGVMEVALGTLVSLGSKIVLVEQVDRSVAEKYWAKYNTMPWHPECKYFYKAIAE